MIFRELAVAGTYVLEPERHADERGYFARTFCVNELAERGLETEIAQISTSHNERRGTLRGMHFQMEPHGETKIVRCTRGAAHDVVVDLRPDSASFGQWAGAELSVANGYAVYVPRGCAHGFLTLEDQTEIEYIISVPHVPPAASGVRFDDPALGLDWPFEPTVINERDRSFPDVDLEALRTR
jgi:dTDP-4-dehydrorhamnose 3,5-epimerase